MIVFILWYYICVILFIKIKNISFHLTASSFIFYISFFLTLKNNVWLNFTYKKHERDRSIFYFKKKHIFKQKLVSSGFLHFFYKYKFYFVFVFLLYFSSSLCRKKKYKITETKTNRKIKVKNFVVQEKLVFVVRARASKWPIKKKEKKKKTFHCSNFLKVLLWKQQKNNKLNNFITAFCCILNSVYYYFFKSLLLYKAFSYNCVLSFFISKIAADLINKINSI